MNTKKKKYSTKEGMKKLKNGKAHQDHMKLLQQLKILGGGYLA